MPKVFRMGLDAKAPVQLGAFEFDTTTGILLQNGAVVPLGRRAAGLLIVLLGRRGEVVGKDALIDAVWPGLAIEDSNLSVQMAKLRRMLGQDPDGRDWIQTIPRGSARKR